MKDEIFVVALLSLLAQVSGWSDTYRGAVVEYNPITSGDFATSLNVDSYVNFITQAKSKLADIIVFPERGLWDSIPSPIPDPNDRIVPCDSKVFETTKTVKDLSCAAKKSQIYTVINLSEKRQCSSDDPNCPPSKFYTYNTNVVFDRSGMVIARYAKFNLYDEKSNQPEDPEFVFFDTDFGVRFGTFTCFDILFSTPPQRLVQQYNIKNFVFTTFWFSELPFLTALQVQKGWAETNNVNLLASGVNNPVSGSGGSGIYNGKFGHIVQIMNGKVTNKLLVADIPKLTDVCYSKDYPRGPQTFTSAYNYNSTDVSIQEPPKTKTENEVKFNLGKDQIYLFASEVITRGKVLEKQVCSKKNFCCDFYVDMDALSPSAANYTYRAMAFNGVRYFGNSFRGGVQSCGVVLCDGPHINNCTSRVEKIPGLFRFNSIRIKGTFKSRNSFQMPSTLTDGKELKPLPTYKYEFTKKEKDLTSEVSLELLWPVLDLHTFAIWGRDFSRDMEPLEPVAGASAIVPFPFILLTFIGFFIFAH